MTELIRTFKKGASGGTDSSPIIEADLTLKWTEEIVVEVWDPEEVVSMEETTTEIKFEMTIETETISTDKTIKDEDRFQINIINYYLLSIKDTYDSKLL